MTEPAASDDDEPTMQFPVMSTTPWEPLRPTPMHIEIRYPGRPRGRHRKEAIVKRWANWYAILASVWVLILLGWSDVWYAPRWLFWGLLALYAFGLVREWLADRRKQQRGRTASALGRRWHSWRMTDPRTTAGDARGEAHRKADHADTRPSWAQPCECAGPGRCDGSCHLI